MANHYLEDKRPKDFWPRKMSWTLDWVIPSIRERGGLVSEVHTHGLDQFDHKEIQIRLLSGEASVFLLNLIASWIAGKYGKLAEGDRIIVATPKGPFYMHVREENYLGHNHEEIIYRLAWEKDP